MRNRSILGIIAMAILLPFLHAKQADQQPDILLIMPDQWRDDALSIVDFAGFSPKRKGSLGWETRFLNGKLNSKKILLCNDGSIANEETYLNGKLHGKTIGWRGTKRPSWERQYINGKQTSYKQYYRSGLKWVDTLFKDGKPVLKSTWDKDGYLIEKETF